MDKEEEEDPWEDKEEQDLGREKEEEEEPLEDKEDQAL